MVKIPYESTITQAFGKPLAKLSIKDKDGNIVSKHGIKEIEYKAEYDGYTLDEAGYQEIVAKGEAPDHMEVVRWKNARLLAAEKSKVNAEKIKAAGFVEPNAGNDPTILLNTFYVAFKAVVGLEPEWKDKPEAEQVAEARRRASEQSKLDWPVE